MNDELETSGQDINAKVVIGILTRYKYLILTCVIVMVALSSVFAYLKQDIYRTKTKIALEIKDNKQSDLVSDALSVGIENPQDEIALITSTLMIEKALDKLDLGTRYFFKNNFKTVEMYKKSPFIVNVFSMERRMLGSPIYITNIDNEHFRLELRKPPLTLKRIKKKLFSNPRPPIIFSKKYKYGEEVVTSWFKIKLQKLSDLGNREYYFAHVPNREMFSLLYLNLSVGFISKESSVLEIGFEDNVPLRAQEIVNALAATYLEDQVSEKNKATKKTLKFLDNELASLNKALSQSASKLKTFKQVNSSAILDKAAENTSNRISEIATELRKLEFEKSVLDNLKIYIDDEKDLANITLSSEELSNSALIEKIDKYQLLNEERRKLLVSYTEFHPDVIKTNDEINSMKQQVKYILDSSLIKLERKKNFLNGEHKHLVASMQALPQQERNLANLTRNFSVNEKIYSFLLEKRTETEILLSSTSQNIRVLDPATIPKTAIRPQREMIIITGAVFGFLIGAMIAFGLYFRDDTVKSSDEVELFSHDIPIYASIPYLKKKIQTPAYQEAYRTLRTNIEFCRVSDPSKVILVSSAISGEGKSTTIRDLSEMIVKLNKKTVVIDLDLRRPSFHKYYEDINNTVGMSTLLSGQSDLSSSIQTIASGIDVIVAGPTPPNPSELIMSEATTLLLETLKRNYDYILIDTPPYDVVTDAVILMPQADIILFSVMLEHTKRESIRHLKSMIEKYRIKAAGIVLHGLVLKKKESHGYGYYEST